jgi:hypothetical protein
MDQNSTYKRFSAEALCVCLLLIVSPPDDPYYQTGSSPDRVGDF